MTLRWLLAALHLLALGIGLGAVVARGLALRSRLDGPGLRWVFFADTAWGVAALLWIGTGLWRLLGGLEKGTGYYFENHAFLAKMALLAAVLALELRPMMTLIGCAAASCGVNSRRLGRRPSSLASALFRPPWSCSWCFWQLPWPGGTGRNG